MPSDTGISVLFAVDVLVGTAAVFAVVILATRIVGLRSFSKMSSFDFAMTIAVGSVMGSVAVNASSFVGGVIAIAVLFAVQVLLAIARRAGPLRRAIDNEPLLLAGPGGEIIWENMRKARVVEDDLKSKLREANVLRKDQIQAIVLETTGDISVLHGDSRPDDWLLSDIRR